jgi:uncharacterized protein
MPSSCISRALFLITAATALSAGSSARAQPRPAEAPSFDCAKARPDSVETLICRTPQLTALDAEMARLYGRARWGAPARNSQKEWLRRRDACHGAPNEVLCTRDSYLSRIVELRVLSKAASRPSSKSLSLGPVAYRCEGMDGHLFATFVNVEPALVRLRHKSSVWVFERARSASGARYVGPAGEEQQLFWSKGQEATARLGAGSAQTHCKEKA